MTEISTGPSEPSSKSKSNDDGEDDKDKDNDEEDDEDDGKEKINGFKESEESDQSKEDIKIGEEVKPSEARRKMAKLISCFSSLNLFTRVSGI